MDSAVSLSLEFIKGHPVDAARIFEGLKDEQAAAFLEGILGGSVADYQTAAFLMAVYFQGLSPAELETFTRAMI